ncbi:MAG: restriction endonuclease [Cuniculiplasma sp.]
MEFKFDSNLEFQLNAIKSVVDLFSGQMKTSQMFVDAIIPNSLTLSEKAIKENLGIIQKENKLEESKLESMDFSVEMETGTGKTYIYLRTILELNLKYSFRKFIVVVPSVAIKEGVLKSLEITRGHFAKIYDNIPYLFYEYDSSKINKIRQFARSNSLEIMVMTIDSFNKDTTVMNKSLDKLAGEKPIDLVRRTKPILILDEPQNMETDIRKKAIASLNPLFKLRYSATHKEYYNLVYRLTPFEAYNKNLVKKIEVLSVVKENDFNNLFIQCEDIVADAKGLYAVLKLNKKQKSGYKITSMKISKNDNMEKKTNNPDYKDLRITKIDARWGTVEFSNGLTLNKGAETGDTKEALMRIQIKQTIEEHFRKAQLLKKHDIKVLSLFFIDRVANYKSPDGFIRKTFIEEFEEVKKKYPEYKDLDVNTVHDGYFSEKYKTELGMESDKDAFDLIMRNKERLLSLEEPTQFIFSHSALREGWDNPNVFNICVLRELNSEISRRQTIGRGIRLPVNKDGDRVLDPNINRLTVVASESYTDYCQRLQQEYERDGFIEIPPKPPNARTRTTVALRKGFILNSDFKELWSKISKKTRYAVEVDTEDLVDTSLKTLNEVNVEKIEVRTVRVNVEIKENKINAPMIIGEDSQEIELGLHVPNLLDIIGQDTNLTRKTIYNILTKSKTFDGIFNNPREYIDLANKKIKEILTGYLTKGIRYIEIGEQWEMKLFENMDSYEEYVYRLDKNNCIYDGVIFDSENEKCFAQKLNDDPRIKLFIKLPNWFVVETPIGTYNPDWAIVLEDQKISGEKKPKVYLVRETKFVENLDNLRPSETNKISRAKEHFKTIDVNFEPITSYDKLYHS